MDLQRLGQSFECLECWIGRPRFQRLVGLVLDRGAFGQLCLRQTLLLSNSAQVCLEALEERHAPSLAGTPLP